MEGINRIGILTVSILIAATLLVLIKSFEDMYIITFYDNGHEVTVGTDVNGIVTRVRKGGSKWRDRAIIGPEKLKNGGRMQMYDLYSDNIFPQEYEVKEVRYDGGIL